MCVCSLVQDHASILNFVPCTVQSESRDRNEKKPHQVHICPNWNMEAVGTHQKNDELCRCENQLKHNLFGNAFFCGLKKILIFDGVLMNTIDYIVLPSSAKLFGVS